MAFHRSGFGRLLFCQVADFLQRARLEEDQVVRHDVGVLENDFHRLAGLDYDALLVEEHLIGDGADADNPHAKLPKLLTG